VVHHRARQQEGRFDLIATRHTARLLDRKNRPASRGAPVRARGRRHLATADLIITALARLEDLLIASELVPGG
jgi:hypothetical protein